MACGLLTRLTPSSSVILKSWFKLTSKTQKLSIHLPVRPSNRFSRYSTLQRWVGVVFEHTHTHHSNRKASKCQKARRKTKRSEIGLHTNYDNSKIFENHFKRLLICFIP